MRMQPSAPGPSFRRYDWDAAAGIVAAVAALILQFLHVVQMDVLLPITLVLVALLLLRQLRHEEREERVEDATARSERTTALQSARGARRRPYRAAPAALGKRDVRSTGARRHGVVQRLPADASAPGAGRLSPEDYCREPSCDPNRVRPQ